MAYNPEHHQRVKHIERRHFYLRELVEDLRITVPYVATADNLADFFTKPLKGKQFFAMRDILMNVPSRVTVPRSLRGGVSQRVSWHEDTRFIERRSRVNAGPLVSAFRVRYA